MGRVGGRERRPGPCVWQAVDGLGGQKRRKDKPDRECGKGHQRRPWIAIRTPDNCQRLERGGLTELDCRQKDGSSAVSHHVSVLRGKRQTLPPALSAKRGYI